MATGIRSFLSRHYTRLAIGTFCIAMCGGCSGKPDPHTVEVATFVLDVGGMVQISTTEIPITKSSALPDEYYELNLIDLGDSRVRPQQLEMINDLPHLRTLNLHGLRIGNRALDQITALPALEELELASTRISDVGLERLTRFENLKKLFLYGTLVTPEGVKKFKEAMPECEVFY